jgi:hypothetical protein
MGSGLSGAREPLTDAPHQTKCEVADVGSSAVPSPVALDISWRTKGRAVVLIWAQRGACALIMTGVVGWGCGGQSTGDSDDASIQADTSEQMDDSGSTGSDAADVFIADDAVEPSHSDVTPDSGAVGSDGTEGPPPQDASPQSTCTTDAECAYLQAGLGSCQEGRCLDGACAPQSRPDGWACDDDDPCTLEDQCASGGCTGLSLAGCAPDEEAERSVVIQEVHFDGADNTVPTEFIELYNYGEEAISLAGWSLTAGVMFTFPTGTTLAPGDYLVVAESPETLMERFGVEALGPYSGGLASEGERLELRDELGAIADEVDFQVGYPWPVGAQDSGRSMELLRPDLDNDLGGSWRASSVKDAEGNPRPTPGEANSVATFNAPPQSRKVRHTPQVPTSSDSVVVSVKVTDPQGVAAVSLQYQVVLPGAYLSSATSVPLGELQAAPDTPMSTNSDFFHPLNWESVTLTDDGQGGDAEAGDHHYSVTLPAQGHRTLVRYRIGVEDTSGEGVSVPYVDDPSLNFAYFVTDGIPDYGDHPAEVLESLPIYTLLVRAEDMHEVVGYDGADQFSKMLNGGPNEARFSYNWSATMVYDGVVYDHIRFRLRGGNGRYQLTGKRSYRFRFNPGNFFQAKDAQGVPYAQPWRTLTTGKGFDNRNTLTYDVNCVINSQLMRSAGVPAPYWHWFHFRVLDGAEEAPDPWTGDFWGLHAATETYDKRYLESHGLDKGNLYKLVDSKSLGKDQQRYQARYAVSDGLDHDNIEQNLTGNSSVDFIRAHVNLPNWYAYHAVSEAVRHYDFWPSANKNQVYYFSPDYEPANGGLGRLWVLPWDMDASWGPSWNNGHDAVYNALYPSNGGGSDNQGTPELHHEYLNVVRELRDLLWQPDQVEPLLDRLTQPLFAFAAADKVRWTGGPPDAGNFNGLGGAGATSLEALVDDLKAFAFVGGSWPGGNVGPGGRGAHLDSLQASGGEGGQIPDTPTIMYLGVEGYPADGLVFGGMPVGDPQGDDSVVGIAWRIALDGGPSLDPSVPLHLEMQALWESELKSGNLPSVTLPAGVVVPGESYRVRARALDVTGRWGHWSSPAVFSAGEAANPTAGFEALRLTEVMYHPAEPPPGGLYPSVDFEFLEFQNTGETPLQLGGVQLAGAVTMSFAGGAVVAPGGYVVVARDLDAFEARYGSTLDALGPYEGKLSNGGETLQLIIGGQVVSSWTYDDAPGWPHLADGLGCSLQLVDPLAEPELLESWRASEELHGNPGWAGGSTPPGPVINEVASWWGVEGTWTVELHNPTEEAMDVGGWWLGAAPYYDDFALPDGLSIPAGGHLSLGQGGDVKVPHYQGQGALWLIEPGFVTRVHDHVLHEADGAGEVWGRWPDGAGPCVPMSEPTFGGANSGPRVGPVVITEILATPSAELPEGMDANDLEYIELHNPTEWPVALGGWVLSGGVEWTFAEGSVLQPGGTLLVLSWDVMASSNFERIASFRAHYDVAQSVLLIGGYSGSLSGQGEDVALWRLTESGSHRLEDGVAYGVAAWPAGAAPGEGEAWQRVGFDSQGLLTDSWSQGAPSPGSP